MKNDRIKIIRRISELVGLWLPDGIDFQIWQEERNAPLAILKLVFIRNGYPSQGEPQGSYRWRASRTIDVSEVAGSFEAFAESIDEAAEAAIAAMIESVIDELHNAAAEAATELER